VNNRGYTLIELSMVVLIIGIMLLVAVPRIQDTLLNDDLKAVTRRLVNAAGEMRYESVREQTDHILHIDLNHPSFWSYPADATAEKRAEVRKKAFVLPEGIKIADIRQVDETKQTEGEAQIRFSRHGYADPTVLHLTKDDRAVTLIFNPFLQTVTIEEKYVDFFFNEEDRTAGL
jgi:prepilin-type N-terminal cleavage/methylation domain-containing protein